MLVISRKPGQEVVIGEGPDAIVVKIVRLDGCKVEIGIEAPPEQRILRGELEQEEHDELRQPL